MLPNAKAKFAKLIVRTVKNKSLNEFIYFFVSKKIIKLINNKDERIIINFVGKTILKKKIDKMSINPNRGNIGCKPLGPTLYLIKFKKSIPKHNL